MSEPNVIGIQRSNILSARMLDAEISRRAHAAVGVPRMLENAKATAQCDADARGLLGMGSAAPDLRNIALSIVIQSSDSEDAIRKVYQVWQERCPVYLALTKALPVACSLEIKPT